MNADRQSADHRKKGPLSDPNLDDARDFARLDKVRAAAGWRGVGGVARGEGEGRVMLCVIR